ncbi:MAG: ATP-binding protein [Betaproteobacteria bacterium]|nr:ATP-binding protein [Betaproteobacteria bacterium]
MRARIFSLRRRLLVFLIGLTAAQWIVMSIGAFLDADHEIDRIFDAQLARSAHVLLARADADLDDLGRAGSGIEYDPGRELAFQVWGPGHRLLLRSAAAPAQPMSPQRQGYSDVRIEGARWRVFSQWDGRHGLLIQVGERYAIRHKLAGLIALRMGDLTLVGLPVLAFLIWVGVGQGLLPLQRVAKELRSRAPEHLAPLDMATAPVEVLPLIEALNALLSQVAGAMEHERRFTADAAHELRTPLAALRAQAQVALRANADGVRRQALHQVMQGVDRAAHLVDQLLTLARFDPDLDKTQWRSVDLRAIAAEGVSEMAPGALAKGVELALAPGAPCAVRGDPGALRILLRNLLDNAVRYSPTGTKVTVQTRKETRACLLEVVDNGPGLAPDIRERAFERFYRGLGSGTDGSGLGLSIVRRVAELHGASVMLAQPASGTGLEVSVRFPQPPNV